MFFQSFAYISQRLKSAWGLLRREPPEPTYSRNVRVRRDRTLPIIVVLLFLIWIAAQVVAMS